MTSNSATFIINEKSQLINSINLSNKYQAKGKKQRDEIVFGGIKDWSFGTFTKTKETNSFDRQVAKTVDRTS